MDANNRDTAQERTRIIVKSDAASTLEPKFAKMAIERILSAHGSYDKLAEAAKFIGVDTKFLEKHYTSYENIAHGCLGLSHENELLSIYGQIAYDGTIEVSMIRNLSRLHLGESDKVQQWGRTNMLWGGSDPLTENDIAIITSDEVSAIRLRYIFSILEDRLKVSRNNKSPFRDKSLLIASVPSLRIIPSMYKNVLGDARCILAPAPEYLRRSECNNMQKEIFVASGLNCVCQCILPENGKFVLEINSKEPYKQAKYIMYLYFNSLKKRNIFSRGMHHIRALLGK